MLYVYTRIHAPMRNFRLCTHTGACSCAYFLCVLYVYTRIYAPMRNFRLRTHMGAYSCAYFLCVRYVYTRISRFCLSIHMGRMFVCVRCVRAVYTHVFVNVYINVFVNAAM